MLNFSFYFDICIHFGFVGMQKCATLVQCVDLDARCKTKGVLHANVGFETADKEPCEVCPLSLRGYLRFQHLRISFRLGERRVLNMHSFEASIYR